MCVCTGMCRGFGLRRPVKRIVARFCEFRVCVVFGLSAREVIGSDKKRDSWLALASQPMADMRVIHVGKLGRSRGRHTAAYRNGPARATRSFVFSFGESNHGILLSVSFFGLLHALVPLTAAR